MLSCAGKSILEILVRRWPSYFYQALFQFYECFVCRINRDELVKCLKNMRVSNVALCTCSFELNLLLSYWFKGCVEMRGSSVLVTVFIAACVDEPANGGRTKTSVRSYNGSDTPEMVIIVSANSQSSQKSVACGGTKHAFERF